MVYAETDTADMDLTQQFTHFGECLMTIYTGRTLHVTGGTYDKMNKLYYVDTANGKELKFRKSAVLCIDEVVQ